MGGIFQQKTSHFIVGRGAVLRHAAGARFPERSRGTGPRATDLDGERLRGTGPRDTKQQRLPLPVGRGPVPRHARC